MMASRTLSPDFCLGKVAVGAADECWPYIGRDFVKSGNGACTYGRIKVNGKRVRAHRLAWEQSFGPVPSGMYVCHHCDNPLCCNPAHLFIGDAVANNHDKMAKGRARSALGEKQGNSKLSDAAAIEVARRARAGEPHKVLAAEYGISMPLVSVLKHGKSRGWLVGVPQ